MTPVLYGGPLTEGYIFEFIHFHWAQNDGDGSENYLNGQNYELEMHLGHRNSKYRDLAEAGMNQDGIVVLAFLFTASNNARDWPLLAELDRVQRVNSTVTPGNPERYLLSNFVGDLNERVVQFRGSLTTPPCSPANWIVVPQLRRISRNDVSDLVIRG